MNIDLKLIFLFYQLMFLPKTALGTSFVPIYIIFFFKKVMGKRNLLIPLLMTLLVNPVDKILFVGSSDPMKKIQILQTHLTSKNRTIFLLYKI